MTFGHGGPGADAHLWHGGLRHWPTVAKWGLAVALVMAPSPSEAQDYDDVGEGWCTNVYYERLVHLGTGLWSTDDDWVDDWVASYGSNCKSICDMLGAECIGFTLNERVEPPVCMQVNHTHWRSIYGIAGADGTWGYRCMRKRTGRSEVTPPLTTTPTEWWWMPDETPSPTDWDWWWMPVQTPSPTPWDCCGSDRWQEEEEEDKSGSSDAVIVIFFLFLIAGGIVVCVIAHNRSENQPEGKTTEPGEVEIVDEEAACADKSSAAMARVPFPTYWTNAEEVHFDQMVYVKREKHTVFDSLLGDTYVPKATQDRACPKGRCPRTPGGCPCVQPEGDPGLPKGFRVRRVVRVEDSEMWSRYVHVRRRIRARRQQNMPLEGFDPPVKTDEVAVSKDTVFQRLDKSLNEVYLLHGTSVRHALSIAQNDFRIDLAGSQTGTMYGRGAYLAESSTKADEYAADEDGYYKGCYALLVCRVILGRFYLTTQREETAVQKVGPFAEHDSVCGDRIASAGTYREFVVCDADQIYPEYVIIYRRVARADDPAQVEASLANTFHMELPVYWTNGDKRPREDPFHAQYLVRSSTRQLLQRLCDACMKDSETTTKTGVLPWKQCEVVAARRVENSDIWNRYVDFKIELRRLLRRRGQDRFTTAEVAFGRKDSGRVITGAYLDTETDEAVVSADNLEEPLNEHLLWHGTTKEAAEKIARDDFHIPKNHEAKHGHRFGVGAYLAEDLAKSLTYARDETDDSNGEVRRYVLLCRALCGDIYSTTNWVEPGAAKEASEQGKHCVVANPGSGKSQREFIVLGENQVYPEYILELREVKPTPEEGPQALCINGCGNPVAPGLTKNGNPYKTCSRNCPKAGSPRPVSLGRSIEAALDGLDSVTATSI